MPDRVVVFLDYQNVYSGARRAFHQPDDAHCLGQFHPVLLAQHLATASRLDQALAQVRIYRGLPDPRLDPKSYAAALRQFHAWSASPFVKVITRPLRYPRRWRPQTSEPPREKGIDVALAVDFAVMARDKEYDVGILFSTDTDMKPALEYVAVKTGARPEVAAWFGARHTRLEIKESRLWCHWIREPVYRQVADPTVYSKK